MWKKKTVTQNSDFFIGQQTFRGIRWDRVFEVEARLKQDILAEAFSNRGNVLIHDEREAFKIIPCWEAAAPSVVLSSVEVYEMLRK